LLKHKASPKTYVLTGSKAYFMEPRTVQYRFKSMLQACGVADANFHALRHTFATRAVEAGFEIKSLSEILGHSSVKITLDRYVHSSFELKREQMEKMSI
jgi:integrase